MELDPETIRKASEGDREAFASIYHRYFDDVYKFIYWNTGSREEAEDLTEEVFYRVLKYIDRYEEKKASFKSWIFRIARNLVIDHFRSSSRRTRAELDERAEEGAGDFQEGLEAAEERREVRRALRILTEEQRQVVVMKYFLEMDNAEIAEVLGKREGAVNALHHRAIRRLQDFLGSEKLSRDEKG